MKLNISLCVLFALVVMATAQGGHDGGRDPPGTPPGTPSTERQPSGGNRCGVRSSDSDACHKAKRACMMTTHGEDSSNVFLGCYSGKCAVNAGTAVLNGVTYTFKRCSQKQPQDNDEERHGVCLGNPPVLPGPTAQNIIVHTFCEPNWYHMACLVTSGTTIIKPECDCPNKGQCIPGAATGTYVYKGNTVNATFCTNCKENTQQDDSVEDPCQLPDISVYASWTQQQCQAWFSQALENNCVCRGK